MASLKAPWVGGNLSDCACFFLNKPNLSSFTWKVLVIGWYRWQTNFSTYFMVSSSECSVVPRFTRAVMTSSSALLKTFQHANFPFPEMLPVLSAPLKAWKAGRAAALAKQSDWKIGIKLILRPYVFGLYQLQSRCFGRAPESILGTTQRHLCLASGLSV